MNLCLHYNGTVYGFTRDGAGNGFWYCIKGRVPGVLGKYTPGMTVPTMLATELSKEAVRQGLASFKDLSRQLRKEKKAKTIRVRVATKSKQKKLAGFFNPFSLENSVKSEAQLEVERALEEIKKPKSKKIIDEEETTTIFADLFSDPDEPFVEEEEEEIELDLEEIESEISDAK